MSRGEAVATREQRIFAEMEQQGDDAARDQDLGRAIARYHEAVRAFPGADAEDIVRVAEKAAVLARHWVSPLDAMPLLESVIGRDLTATQRGRVLFGLAHVYGYAGDEGKRTTSLLDARSAFDAAGEDAWSSKMLGALALPFGDDLTIEERIAFGEEGLALATKAGADEAFAHCAGNLAFALSTAGSESSFTLWEKSVAALERLDSRGPRDDALRYTVTWVAGALAYGRSDVALSLVRKARRRPLTPYWKRRLAGLEAVALWRRGKWDEAASALRVADLAHPDGNVPITANTRGVALALTFEREREQHPVPSDWLADVVSRVPILLGGTAVAIAVSIRHARREPGVGRTLQEFAHRALRQHARVGWEDLLPVAARIAPKIVAPMVEDASGLGLSGDRAHACITAAKGFMSAAAKAPEAYELLIEAAEAYERLSEPHPMAKMLEAAGDVIVRDGRHAGALRARAAETYAQIGADRSLASLIRGSRRTRALSGHRIPGSQSFATSPGLTRRERDVAELAARGHPAGEIALSLGVSEATVRTHLASVKRKLGARRKSDLVRMFTS